MFRDRSNESAQDQAQLRVLWELCILANWTVGCIQSFANAVAERFQANMRRSLALLFAPCTKIMILGLGDSSSTASLLLFGGSSLASPASPWDRWFCLPPRAKPSRVWLNRTYRWLVGQRRWSKSVRSWWSSHLPHRTIRSGTSLRRIPNRC